jgi:uncharacterized beta-barrel protein YwiB (DUF1934 family)
MIVNVKRVELQASVTYEYKQNQNYVAFKENVSEPAKKKVKTRDGQLEASIL